MHSGIWHRDFVVVPDQRKLLSDAKSFGDPQGEGERQRGGGSFMELESDSGMREAGCFENNNHNLQELRAER